MTTHIRNNSGFTLVELIMAVAVLMLLVGIAVPLYQGHAAEALIQRTIQDIRQIELLVVDMGLDGRFPDSLADAGADKMLDPWGNPYQYLNIRDGATGGKARKDKFLVPVNSDFDLYSLGADGKSSPPFTAKDSRDDIVRANNGAFFGIAEDY